MTFSLAGIGHLSDPDRKFPNLLDASRCAIVSPRGRRKIPALPALPEQHFWQPAAAGKGRFLVASDGNFRQAEDQMAAGRFFESSGKQQKGHAAFVAI